MCVSSYGCLLWGFGAVIKYHVQKQLEEDRVYMAYTTHLSSSLTEGRAEADVSEEKPLTGLLRQLSLTRQDHLPGNGTAHSGLGFPTSIANQEHLPQPCLQAHLMEAFFFQLRLPLLG